MPRFHGHRPVGVPPDVADVARGDVPLSLEPARVVDEELKSAVVSRLDVERAPRVREPVLAVVHLREGHEQLRGMGALLLGDVLAGSDAIEDRRRVLLLEAGIVVVDLPRHRQRARGPLQIARELPRVRFVAEERESARGVRLDRELRFVHRERFVPLPLPLEQLAKRIDRERASGVELDRATEGVDRLLRLRQRGFAPQAPELLLHSGELAADLRIRGHERRERLAPAIEQRDERLHVPLLAIELREALGGDLLGRVLVDRHHEDARRAVRISKRRRPDVRGFAQPVRGVARVVGLGSDLLEEERVRLRIRGSGAVCIRERFLVVRIRYEALDERVNFAGIHLGADVTTGSFLRAIRAPTKARRGGGCVVARRAPQASSRHSKRP